MVGSGRLRTRLQQECRREWDHNDSSQGGYEVQSSICVDESDGKGESTTEGGHGLHVLHRQDNLDFPEDIDGVLHDQLEEVNVTTSARKEGDGSCDCRMLSNDSSRCHK